MKSLLEKSMDLYKKGNLEQAEKYALKHLKSDPRNASSYINLGNIHFLRKNYPQALANYQKADSLRQDYYYSKINLANVYGELQNYDRAIFYSKQALNLKSDSKLAYQILGASYLEQKKYEDSIQSFLHAVKLDPTDPWLYNFLSQSYQKNNSCADALKAGWEAVKLSPNDDSHHINFGYLLYEYDIENIDNKAKEYASIWLHHYSENSIAQHMGNAILSNQKIIKANDKYLADIFDVFSSDFDSVLEDLDYQVPNLISKALSKIYNEKSDHKSRPQSWQGQVRRTQSEPYGDTERSECTITNHKLSILDIGCGTGLCGEFLKNYKCWRGLEGVDISSKMLEKARQKNIYNKLRHAELETFISTRKNKYDLMVAADVFTYIGDLEKLFLNINAALKKQGRILFSISENTLNESGFFLTPSGRFVHSRNYIENILQNAGFDIEIFDRKKLRNEGDKAVTGYIISCKKV